MNLKTILDHPLGRMLIHRAPRVSALLARLAADLLSPRAALRTIENNLAAVFPERTPAQIKALARKHRRSMFEYGVEQKHLDLLSREELVTYCLDRVELTGWEHLHEALDRREPIVVFTPHYGNFAVCSLRLAVNSRRKDESGNWIDKPNYFDITVWGAQGENCAQYLAKGRPVGVQGRLEWREWDAQDGTKRQAVEVVADNVQFLGSRDGGGEGGGQQFVPQGAGAAQSASADFPAAAADDDIPF